MVNESASKIKQDNAAEMILVKRDNRQGNLRGLSSLSYTPIKAYCTAGTGVFAGSMTGGKGPDRHSVLYYWLIPDRNV